jgi:hypothetical protein
MQGALTYAADYDGFCVNRVLPNQLPDHRQQAAQLYFTVTKADGSPLMTIGGDLLRTDNGVPLYELFFAAGETFVALAMAAHYAGYIAERLAQGRSNYSG